MPRIIVQSGGLTLASLKSNLLKLISGDNVTLSVIQSSDGCICITVSASSGSGTPSGTVESETAFGQSSAAGVSSDYSRGDHTHGSPTDPVTAHIAESDPHTGYRRESVSIVEADFGFTDVATANASATAHGLLPKWPDNTTTFFRGDGIYSAPTATVPDPNQQSYSPGSFTLLTEKYAILSRHLKLTTTQRATLQGTGTLRIV